VVTVERDEEMLLRILGLSDAAPLRHEGEKVRRRLRELLARTGASGTASLEDIAAYASELLDGTWGEKPSLSGRVFFEAECARDFLARVESATEAAPPDLVSAAVAAVRKASSAMEPSLLEAIQRRLSLTVEQMQHLLFDPELRRSLRRALSDLTAGPFIQMPALAAAASDTEVGDRDFPGGRVRSYQVRDHELDVLFTFKESSLAPCALWLRGVSGEMWLEPLPPPDADGDIFLVKDLRNTAHALFARLLRDPGTIGEFLP
jgi:hypothetical protein